ncbi:MAG TPA: hypothetical protein VMH50_12840 [Thermoleophilia bacterium]|nr:hypothetical protein [Thermoleophilia bacterium]
MSQPPVDPRRAPFAKRNSAPFWKKLAIVLAAVIALVIVGPALHTSHLPSLAVLGLIILIVVAVVWVTAKVLGVRLSLRSWD